MSTDQDTPEHLKTLEQKYGQQLNQAVQRMTHAEIPGRLCQEFHDALQALALLPPTPGIAQVAATLIKLHYEAHQLNDDLESVAGYVAGQEATLRDCLTFIRHHQPHLDPVSVAAFREVFHARQATLARNHDQDEYQHYLTRKLANPNNFTLYSITTDPNAEQVTHNA